MDRFDSVLFKNQMELRSISIGSSDSHSIHLMSGEITMTTSYLLSKVEYMGIPTDDLYQTAYTDINTSLGVFDNLDALRAKVNKLEGKVVLWSSSVKSFQLEVKFYVLLSGNKNFRLWDYTQ